MPNLGEDEPLILRRGTYLCTELGRRLEKSYIAAFLGILYIIVVRLALLLDIIILRNKV